MLGKNGFLTYVLDFLAVFQAWDAEFVGIILKWKYKLCIMGFELYYSASRRVSKRAGATFVKTNGKCQLEVQRRVSILRSEITDWFWRAH